jgi:hypothetical protein
MKLTDIHNRETEIRDAAHLESLFAETPEIDGYGAFMIYTAVGEPELWLHFNDDIAYPHYFPTSDGSHPGWQPESEERPEHVNLPETIIFLQVGAIMADRIEMPRETTVSKRKAIAAAKEFLMDQQLPPSISWFEL